MLQLSQVSILLKGEVLIAPFSLEVAAGEIVTLMGPSGSGKSSLLSGIAGTLRRPFQITGQVLLNGRALNELRPEARRVGRMFQDDVLFPHLTVGENLLFGLARGLHAKRLSQMREGLKEIELEGFEDRAPHSLSGGQRQRVSLMRSLLARPDCMLLDEPFGELDQTLRTTIKTTAFELLRMHRVPTLLVTHEPADAPRGARILQIGRGGKVSDV